MTATKDIAAKYLSPTQFAIGITSGIETITQTLKSHVQRYITNPLTQNMPPSRVLLILNLIIIFNTISMTKAREIIYDNFQHLLPLFDILYSDTSKCWYRQPNGHRNSSQGCPFAAFLACPVLDSVTKPIQEKLIQRVQARKTKKLDLDDGQGSTGLMMSYIDDTTVSLPYEDLRFFLHEFNRLGTPLGCKLNPKNAKSSHQPTTSHQNTFSPKKIKKILNTPKHITAIP